MTARSTQRRVMVRTTAMRLCHTLPCAVAGLLGGGARWRLLSATLRYIKGDVPRSSPRSHLGGGRGADLRTCGRHGALPLRCPSCGPGSSTTTGGYSKTALTILATGLVYEGRVGASSRARRSA